MIAVKNGAIIQLHVIEMGVYGRENMIRVW